MLDVALIPKNDCKYDFKAFVDSGSSVSLIQRSCVCENVKFIIGLTMIAVLTVFIAQIREFWEILTCTC